MSGVQQTAVMKVTIVQGFCVYLAYGYTGLQDLHTFWALMSKYIITDSLTANFISVF